MGNPSSKTTQSEPQVGETECSTFKFSSGQIARRVRARWAHVTDNAVWAPRGEKCTASCWLTPVRVSPVKLETNRQPSSFPCSVLTSAGVWEENRCLPLQANGIRSSVLHCLPDTVAGLVRKKASAECGTLKTKPLDRWLAIFCSCFVFAFCQLFFGLCPPWLLSNIIYPSASIYWPTSMSRKWGNVLTARRGGWYCLQGLLAICCARVFPVLWSRSLLPHGSPTFLMDLHPVMSVCWLILGSWVQDRPLLLSKPEDFSLSQRAYPDPESRLTWKLFPREGVATSPWESPAREGHFSVSGQTLPGTSP